MARSRLSIGAPLLRLRSDEQLVALFRAGNDDAFRVIHDRYRQRLFAYTRQMLAGSRQDAEDALQDVFVRAYASLRSNDRQLALRAWLYRVAHNRCIDELRRPAPPNPELLELVRVPANDPMAEAEQRESLRRLVEDVRRLPEQQRSALLMRELSGMSYSELAGALAVSVPAVKSLLVRARVGLAAAREARDTACSDIRDELTLAHDRRIRPNATARRHLRDCAGCREFRTEIRTVSRGLAALVPALGPMAFVAKALGFGTGAGSNAAAGGSAAAGGGAAAGSGAVATGAFATTGVVATGAGHVATLLAAAVVTATGAVAIQHDAAAPVRHHARHHVTVAPKRKVRAIPPPTATQSTPPPAKSSTPVSSAPPAAAAAPPSSAAPPAPAHHTTPAATTHVPAAGDASLLPQDNGTIAQGQLDNPPTGGVAGTGNAGETSTTPSTSGSDQRPSATNSTPSTTGSSSGTTTPTTQVSGALFSTTSGTATGSVTPGSSTTTSGSGTSSGSAGTGTGSPSGSGH